MSNQNNLSWFRFLRPTLSSLITALKEKNISSTDLVLYLLIRSETALAGRGYVDGVIELTINDLIGITGFSQSTIKRTLVNLRKQGYLSKISDCGESGRYLVRDIAHLPGDQVASWPYIPRDETQLLKDLNNYIRGDSSDAPSAEHIKNLQINIQVNHYHNSDEQDNPKEPKKEDLQSMITMINAPSTPAKMRENLKRIYTQFTDGPGQ